MYRTRPISLQKMHISICDVVPCASLLMAFQSKQMRYDLRRNLATWLTPLSQRFAPLLKVDLSDPTLMPSIYDFSGPLLRKPISYGLISIFEAPSLSLTHDLRDISHDISHDISSLIIASVAIIGIGLICRILNSIFSAIASLTGSLEPSECLHYTRYTSFTL